MDIDIDIDVDIDADTWEVSTWLILEPIVVGPGSEFTSTHLFGLASRTLPTENYEQQNEHDKVYLDQYETLPLPAGGHLCGSSGGAPLKIICRDMPSPWEGKLSELHLDIPDVCGQNARTINDLWKIDTWCIGVPTLSLKNSQVQKQLIQNLRQ